MNLPEKIDSQPSSELAPRQPLPNDRLKDRIEFAQHESVTGRWSKPWRGSLAIELHLPYKDYKDGYPGGIRGTLAVEGPRRGEMQIERIEVDEHLRGNGLGKRLLQTLAAEAKHTGATTLVGDIISEQQIHNRIQTFGEDNVVFFDTPPVSNGQANEVEIPLTREQAIQSLHRAQQTNENATIGARTNLASVDTAEWELPTLAEGSEHPSLNEQHAVAAQELGNVATGALLSR